ncbi:hypothetical protein PHLCEN_2v7016 [Hermanssonia centrifuga]|uniref:Uncharacterized protein n=1 Tax=Hermanssonia centrifuga TaxID=98765 RepID=A0A2R6NXS2_9APHY|nr:hypothetical protein PHLCEN_2v7016 [Hermanssonia centrifuga]
MPASWGFLQSAFVQGILNYIPSLRKSIEPTHPESEAAVTSSPAEVEPWKEEVDRWKQLADKAAAERDQLRHEAAQLHGEMQRLVRDLSQVRTEAEENWKSHEQELRREGQEEISKREMDIQKTQEELATVKQDRADMESLLGIHIRKLETELSTAKQNHADIEGLLGTHKIELDAVQRVLGRDNVGEDEVTQLLQSLNDEIAQTAKATRELFKVDKAVRGTGKAVTDAAGAIEGWVGSAIPALLSTQYRGNPILVQAALQAMAVAFTSWISSSYSFMHEHDQVLDETYKYLMNAEDQAVLGRWRALTHKYAKQGMPNLTDELTKMLVTDVRNLLLVAGSSTGQADSLIARKRDNFRAIVELAINLRRSIGEDIISCDFETILIHPGDAFDAANMEDAFESISKSKGSGDGTTRKVLCTAGLGLRRCRKTKGEGETAGQWDVTVMRKPQVILDTVMQGPK